jgi:cysteinyl-tRNA synthetase
MNVTDVGHLTSDADEGEDKMEKAAKKEHKKASDLADFYLKVFQEDLKKLNILDPNIWCKATEHIKEQIATVKTLEEKGFTYKTSDGIYFDTSKLDDYGKLDPHHKVNLEGGKRVDLGEKKNKTDFALWKFSEKPGTRQQEWEAFGKMGFPGWHIECSSMSSKYLGEQFDIHTGGEDHVQVHHTNEIAQSEAAFGKKPWVKYWLHGAFLTFKGEKVSKSKGGLYTISELEKQGFEPLDYRYFCLNTHYRKQLSFSLDALNGAKNTFERLKNIILNLKSKKDSNKTKNNYEKQFLDYIDDDLNMPKALSVLWEVLRDKELGSKEKLQLIYDFDKVLGLNIKNIKEEKQEKNKDIDKLIKQRDEARENKDWAKADEIRDKLKADGIELIDSKDGTKWKKI